VYVPGRISIIVLFMGPSLGRTPPGDLSATT
jgi:hypothetical protein